MDIFIPIGIGFVINLVVFIVCKILKQSNNKSLLLCLISFIAVLLSSFIIGSWLGMGIGVISSGMLIFVILTVLVIAFVPHNKDDSTLI
ncbi:YesK family protein [Ureibacillus acetophenoni]|uniref:YesK-like protein n=1 Tax=Ureibacillus acetophenoni TaxID=614649 RepID=A0A285UL98_9BACL|nr:YesK family protein [Ureibacillus acetophenoni]SOC42675.1 YesK-like protein [Ureibacillus acetophenoni]